MESAYYFVPGYTGFCPEQIHCIGKSYGHATRNIMRKIPNLKTRLSPTRWHGSRARKNAPCATGYDEMISVDNQKPCPCPYPSAQDFKEGYGGFIPKNVCLCAADAESDRESERSRPSYPPTDCGDACPFYEQDVYQDCNCDGRSASSGGTATSNNAPSSSACGYWAAYPKGVVHFPVPGSRGPQNNGRGGPPPPPKACCGSCARGGSCEGDQSSAVSGNAGPQAPQRVRFPRVMPHRSQGVIVNYTGHIPGEKFAHGETYGNTSRRLLAVHFDNMARQRMQEKDYM